MSLTVGNQQILQWCSCHKKTVVRIKSLKSIHMQYDRTLLFMSSPVFSTCNAHLAAHLYNIVHVGASIYLYAIH